MDRPSLGGLQVDDRLELRWLLDLLVAAFQKEARLYHLKVTRRLEDQSYVAQRRSGITEEQK
jgi:hypothetical protein